MKKNENELCPYLNTTMATICLMEFFASQAACLAIDSGGRWLGAHPQPGAQFGRRQNVHSFHIYRADCFRVALFSTPPSSASCASS